MPVMKIAQQGLKRDAWNFTGPDDLGMVNVGCVVDPLNSRIVVSRIVHNDQIVSRHVPQLCCNALPVLQRSVETYALVGYGR